MFRMTSCLFGSCTCPFPRCSLHFATPYDVIAHIEDAHHDPPLNVCDNEQTKFVRPGSIYKLFPSGYKPTPVLNKTQTKLHFEYMKKRTNSVSSTCIPLGRQSIKSISERKDDVDEIDDGGDGSINGIDGIDERRYRCPHEGCDRRYKNLQGVKYHVRSAHSRTDDSNIMGIGGMTNVIPSSNTIQGSNVVVDGFNGIVSSPNGSSSSVPSIPSIPPSTPTKYAMSRPYKCNQCSKRYKTTMGLQNHISAAHNKSMNINSGSDGSSNVSSSSVNQSVQEILARTAKEVQAQEEQQQQQQQQHEEAQSVQIEGGDDNNSRRYSMISSSTVPIKSSSSSSIEHIDIHESQPQSSSQSSTRISNESIGGGISHNEHIQSIPPPSNQHQYYSQQSQQQQLPHYQQRSDVPMMPMISGGGGHIDGGMGGGGGGGLPPPSLPQRQSINVSPQRRIRQSLAPIRDVLHSSNVPPPTSTVRLLPPQDDMYRNQSNDTRYSIPPQSQYTHSLPPTVPYDNESISYIDNRAVSQRCLDVDGMSNIDNQRIRLPPPSLPPSNRDYSSYSYSNSIDRSVYPSNPSHLHSYHSSISSHSNQHNYLAPIPTQSHQYTAYPTDNRRIDNQSISSIPPLPTSTNTSSIDQHDYTRT